MKPDSSRRNPPARQNRRPEPQEPRSSVPTDRGTIRKMEARTACRGRFNWAAACDEED